jgi:dihydropyrimidinase
MSILIRSGTLITDQQSFQADILIEGETIAAVGPQLTSSVSQVLDAQGMLVMPGGVDVHTHFDLPMFNTVSSDDHYTGHKAAAFGGTTTVIDFVPQEPGPLEASVAAWHAKADEKAAVDFGFHMNITRWDAGVAKDLSRLPGLGITSIKVFTAYNNRLRLGDGEIFQAMRLAHEYGLLTMLHAENGDVIEVLTQEALQAGYTTPIWHAKTRPAWGAVEAALRGIALAAQSGAALYIVHMNVGGEVDMLDYARQRGLPVMGETCPQYLFFTEDHLSQPDGAKWICSPPMRTAADNLRIWQGVIERMIQVIGTDHCPFFYNGNQPIQYEGQPVLIPGKELGQDDFTKIPNGLPGVGDRLPVLWTSGVGTGKLTPNQFVALMSTNPAKIFGLYPQKGSLLPGSDADLVIWDPARRIRYGAAVAQHRTDYNLFEGWELVGFPRQVYLRGQLIVDQGEWLGHRGMGRYMHRQPGMVL